MSDQYMGDEPSDAAHPINEEDTIYSLLMEEQYEYKARASVSQRIVMIGIVVFGLSVLISVAFIGGADLIHDFYTFSLLRSSSILLIIVWTTMGGLSLYTLFMSYRYTMQKAADLKFNDRRRNGTREFSQF